MTPHRIKRVTLALTTADAASARAWSDRCRDLFPTRIAPLLGRLCSEADDSPHLRRIDRLELDLGRLDPNDDETIIIRLTDALRPALARALADRPHDPSAAPLALLTLFARTGNLPWSADRTTDPVAAALTALLTTAPHALQSLLRDLADDPPAIARLARHAPPPVLAALLAHTFPDHAALLAPVRRALEPTSHEPPEQSPHPLALRHAVLTTLTRGDVGPETFAPLLALTAHFAEPSHSPHFTRPRPPALRDPESPHKARPSHSPAEIDSGDSATTPDATIPVRPLDATPIAKNPRPDPVPNAAQPPLRPALARAAPRDRTPPITTHSTPAEVFAHLWRRARDTGRHPRNEPTATARESQLATSAASQHSPFAATTAHVSQHSPLAVSPARVSQHSPPAESQHSPPAARSLESQQSPLAAPPGAQHSPRAAPSGAQHSPLASPAGESHNSPLVAPPTRGSPLAAPPARASNPLARAELLTRRARQHLLAAEGELQLEDGGLVLLWPFLARMFERLELIDEQRRFPTELARQQAIALLAHLSTGDPDPPEYQRTLSKLLCAHDLAEPCMHDAPIPDDHQTEAEHLLHAVIDHVPALHALDIPSFRAAFLVRPAVLGTRDGTWTLQVERRPHDVILDTFPWAWMWLKLPWMPDPLRVEW